MQTSPSYNTDFPRRPIDVSLEWLRATLPSHDGPVDLDRIEQITIEPVGAGKGVLGDIVRVSMLGSAGRPLATLIVKLATPSEANRAIAATLRLFEREVRFYRDFRHTLGDGAPVCYFAALDESTNEFALVLEDLDGYRPGDQVAGCSVEDAAMTLDAIVPLHAVWWGRDAEPMLSPWPRIDAAPVRDGLVEATARSYHVFVERYGNSLPPAVRSIGPTFVEATDELHTRMGRVPQTLVHGDLRLDNVFFGQSSSQRGVVIFDWQATFVAPAALDVAYLLTQSMEPDLRRRHEDQLLTGYHARLCSAGVSGYTLDDLWADYRLATLMLYEYVIVTAAMDATNERGVAFVDAMTRRCGSAIADLDLIELL